ncbi:MAG: hypothetical protein ACRED9_02685 [Caulobacteraceae bacterium]
MIDKSDQSHESRQGARKSGEARKTDVAREARLAAALRVNLRRRKTAKAKPK